MGEYSNQSYVRQGEAGKMDMGQVTQGWVSHGMSFAFYPKCEILQSKE